SCGERSPEGKTALLLRVFTGSADPFPKGEKEVLSPGEWRGRSFPKGRNRSSGERGERVKRGIHVNAPPGIVRGARYFWGQLSRSKMAAIPCPPPTHMVSKPKVLSWNWRALISVVDRKSTRLNSSHVKI